MNARTERIPYPGPRPFETTEKDIFFGRDREIRDLRSLVIAHRAVLLFAQSGAGKTSVLKAGLVPLLRDEGIEVLPIARVQGVDPAKYGLDSVANIFAFNTLLSWAGDKSEPKVLAMTSLAPFLGQRAHGVDKHGDPVFRIAIFDQFEELFTAYPAHWAQRSVLIEQIAEACQADPLLRVVLAIREDHLAELMPHSHLLPEELRASFHLERLSEAAAIGAVEKPLADTGRSFADGVAKSLVKRLLQVKLESSAPGQAPVEAQYVEPVQLQVVCQRLWRQLPGSVKIVTEDQLKAFGDVDEALRSFYEDSIASTVAKTGVPEEKLRRWFDTQLITAGGTRGTVFQGADSTGGIPNPAVQVLEGDHHIVRAELRHGSRWYELTHDRFVAPIRQSNEVWLKDVAAKLRRKRAREYAFLIVVATATLQFGFGWWTSSKAKKEAEIETKNELEKQQQQSETDKQIAVAKIVLETKSALDLQKKKFELDREDAIRRARLQQSERLLSEGQIQRLRAEKEGGSLSDEKAEAVLDGVANYLWEKGDVQKLSSLLEENADLMPSRYGVDVAALALLPSVDDFADWPLIVEHSPRAQLDAARFLYYWRFLAGQFASVWGIPVPMRLKLRENMNLPASQFKILVIPDDRASRPVGPSLSERVVISTDPADVVVMKPDSPPALVKFFNKHKKSQLTQFKYGGEWWLVPAWTQPVWKVTAHRSSDRNGAVALAVASQALNRPELLLSTSSVAFMLDRLARTHRDTVREALAARGLERLTHDMTRIVGEPNKNDLKDLEYLLDTLANLSDATPEQAALVAVEDRGTPFVRFAPRLLGHPPARQEDTLESLKAAAEGRRHVYEEATPWLPPQDSRQIRVAVGERVEQQLARDEKLRPEFLEAMIELRGRFNQRFGFDPPTIRVRADNTLPPDSFRIEVANQKPDQKDLRRIEAIGTQVQPILLKELEDTYAIFRSWWLTPEKVSDLLGSLPRKQQDWLRSRYSLTELKLILRSAIDPSRWEQAGFARGDTGIAVGLAKPEQTISSFDWLMGSLVFWAAASPADRSLSGVTAHMRSVQRARLAVPSPAAAPSGVAKPVADGIRSLQDGRIDLATQSFTEAVARDRLGATAAFYALYAAQAVRVESLSELIEGCKPPPPGKVAEAKYPDIRMRYRIEGFLNRAGSSVPAADRRRLDLCLLWQAIGEKHRQKTDELTTRLVGTASKGDWSPQDQYLLAYLLLDAHGREMSAPKLRDEIEELLRTALSKLGQADAEAAFLELRQRHDSAAMAPRWYVALLRVLSATKPESFWNPLRMGLFLIDGRTEEEAKESLRLFETAKSRLSAVAADHRDRLSAWLELSQGNARVALMEFEPSLDRRSLAYEEAKRLILGVIDRIPKGAWGWPTLDHAFGSLVNAHYNAGRADDIAAAVEAWLARAPASQAALRQKAIVLLTRLQADGAVELLRRSVEQSKGQGEEYEAQKTETLFLTALSETLTGNGNYEEDARSLMNDTQQVDRDFIRLLLFWRLKLEGRDKEAADLITERVGRIDARSWAERLKEGDKTVWREQMLSLFAGSVRLEELLATIRTKESFEAAAISKTGIAYESIASDIHFYDALRQHVSGDPATRQTRFREGLERASRVGRIEFYETHMARYLLNSMK